LTKTQAMLQELSRRNFLKKSTLLSLGLPLISLSPSQIVDLSKPASRKIYVFSKHLHWLNYKDMSDFISEIGFDGVDLTVRKDGHVEPEKVGEQLPLVVELLKKAGKEVISLTTAILNADEPHAEKIIKTAASLNIPLYRTGWFGYKKGISIEKNLETFEGNFRSLITLNEKYKIKGSYQNHAGESFGSSIWDLGGILKKIKSEYIGCQFDVRHAMVEGANSWKVDFEYIRPYINSIDIKDFHWEKKNGKWTTVNVPLGEGMVDFDLYFKMVKELPANIPIILHLEYPLGGAEEGSKKITVSGDVIKKAMKKDLSFIKEKLGI
jgi:sugar phosphate isomerase/epimerase